MDEALRRDPNHAQQRPANKAAPVELLPALVRSSSDIITVLDRAGRIIYASPAATRLLGYPEGSMDLRSVFDLIHPDDLSATRAAFAVGLESPGTFEEPVEVRLRHLNGSWRTVEVLGANVLDDPDVQGIVINGRDVTERRSAQDALRESEERYRVLVERSPESIAVHQDGRFVFVNPAGLNLLGARSESELLGRPVFDVVHPDDRALVEARLRVLGAGKEAELQEERLVRLDGRVIEVEAVAIPITYAGRPAAQVMAHDISDRKHAERDLAHHAMHDGLTDLPNRSLFMDRLTHALARMSRSPSLLGVLFLDLDRFKVVNDSLGHSAGDRLLVSVARRLCDVLRPEDTVARFGGDEFVILCEELQDVTEATRIARRISEALAAPLFEGDEELRAQASIGIALAMNDLATPEELVRDADAAMYRAKERGRGRIEIFDKEMRARAMGRLQQENALRRAIERGELRVHYQPIVSVSDARAIGAEALLRWQHPERGLVGPDEFIGVAEDSGLIVPIGEWVLQESCRQAREWNDARPPGAPALEVAVNLSARQLVQPDLVNVVTRMLTGSGVNPDVMHLCLEITESVLMDDVVVTMRTLERLRELGVRLAIDDFGTGYSSLAYLSRFPIDTLKVDRAFVHGLCEQHHDRAIVASIIELARALGLTVVAEGVESDDQLAVLRQLGCSLAQGFLFARPAPPEALTSLLCHDLPIRAPQITR